MTPKVTIITPVYNAVDLLRSTLESITRQSYDNIQYIIVDGGSNDGTLELIEEYRNIVSCLISEADEGMYDALAKGLRIANGEIVCYLNAGDLLVEKAIEVVVDVFSDESIKWMTGYRSVCNENNVITRVELPFRYKSSLIKKGIYGKWLPYIQQESTFWKKELNDSIDLEKLKSFKLAGDYYLWFSFSNQTSLEVVKTPLGIFKKHEGQLSESLKKYWDEVDAFVSNKNLIVVFQVLYEAVFWTLDSKVREKIVNNVWSFDFKTKAWLCGKKK